MQACTACMSYVSIWHFREYICVWVCVCMHECMHASVYACMSLGTIVCLSSARMLLRMGLVYTCVLDARVCMYPDVFFVKLDVKVL